MLLVKVNKREFLIGVNENSTSVNNQEVAFEVEELENGKFLIRKDGRVFELYLLSVSEDGKEVELQIGQSYFKLDIQTEFDQLLNKLGFKNAGARKIKELKSPMPGKVVSVLVKEGDEIQTGQPLLVLEAMKMENLLQSSSEGKVERILVREGTSVNKNEILIKFC